MVDDSSPRRASEPMWEAGSLLPLANTITDRDTKDCYAYVVLGPRLVSFLCETTHGLSFHQIFVMGKFISSWNGCLLIRRGTEAPSTHSCAIQQNNEDA